MNVSRKLPHFLQLYFICIVGVFGILGLEIKDHHGTDVKNVSSAFSFTFEPRKDTALKQYKSPPFDDNGHRRSALNRHRSQPLSHQTDAKSATVAFSPAHQPATRKNYDSLLPSSMEAKDELHAVDKSENNQAEMKLSQRHRPEGGVMKVVEGVLKSARMLDDQLPEDDDDDDVVDAAKDEYFDTPTREENEGDNYEDGKIINSGALDNFFGGKSTSSSKGASGAEGEYRKGSNIVHEYKSGNTEGAHESNAQEELDEEDEDDEEEEDDEEDDSEVSYGEDVLPPSEAFGTFGGRTEGGLKVEEAPYFLVEPQSTYVIRSKPAVLKCKAANTLQVSKRT